MTTSLDNLDITTPDFKAHMYPIFAQLRDETPVRKIRLPGNQLAWLITRYEDAEAVMRDQRFIKDVRKLLAPQQNGSMPTGGPGPNRDLMMTFGRMMLNTDQPDHARLRTLVSQSFTPRFIEQWRERIQSITDELLDKVQDKGQMDLIKDFSFPLPITVIVEMLGIPNERQGQFRDWSDLIMDGAGNPEKIRQNSAQLRDFVVYVGHMIDTNQDRNANDLLSKLVRAEAGGQKLSKEEMISMVGLLIVAGHETTMSLIANAVLTLLQFPAQLEKLKQDPELIKPAIEELLRYQGPSFMSTQRWASEDLEIHGVQISKGEEVIVALSSANHDNRVFPEAEMLDITRKENAHLAFGKGIHFCLGAPLARLEGQIAINTLLRRFPNLHLAVDPQTLVWRPGSLIMGLHSLPVAW